jgi:dolichol-phosphate mannosyltransferase
MKIAIVIPTYNEKDNIFRIVSEIFDLGIDELEIVVVDDNSPDGTGKILDEIKEKNEKVHAIHRAKKSGLGTAYLEGFRYSLEKGAEYIFAMDADFSHDPKLIPKYLDEIEKKDLVIGSRYIPGGKIKNWDWLRRLISYFGNFFARSILDIQIKDMTAGFKCYRRAVVEHLIDKKISSIGYVFQIETVYYSCRNGFKTKEIPIEFLERRIGKSKFNFGIIWESFWRVIKLRLSQITPAGYLAIFLILAFVASFSFLSFSRHDALKSYLNDLGTYDQVVWNTAHGHFFDNSSNMLNVRNYLGAHFSPILLLFAPFYWIHATPKWLLFFQALAVGMSGTFIYLFAKSKLKKSWVALVFLFSFLLNPFLGNGILYDFHEVVLAVFFASGAFYFLEKEKWKTFFVFSALLALCQEHLVLLVFMMGLYILFIKKKKEIGIYTALFSLAYFFLVLTVFMPHFSQTGNPALISNGSQYQSRYAWLGNSLGEIIKNMIANPLFIIETIFSAERIRYLVMLIVPVFSLAAYSWPVIIVFPLILINLLSSFSMTYSVYFYHSAVLIPFIFFSAIISFRKLFLGNLKFEKLFAILFLAFSLGSFWFFSLFPLALNSKLSDFLPSQNAKEIKKIQTIIPADASLSVQNNLGPHFSERREIYRFPLKIQESDYVILNRYDSYRNDLQKVFGFYYALQMSAEDQKNKIEELKNSPNFKVILDDENYLVFKKKL